MSLPIATYVLPLILSASLSLVIFFISVSRPSPYRIPLALLSLLIVNWSLGYSLELFSTGIEDKLFWVRIQYFSIVGIPPIWLILILQYTGRGNLVNFKTAIFLSIEPVITLVLAWTNQFHHLIWTHVGIIENQTFSMFNPQYGTWSVVNFTYIYSLILYSMFLLLRISATTFQLYRRHIYLLVAAIFAPVLGNVLYTIRVTHIDLTPIMFSVTAAIIAYGFTRHRIFDIMPLAKDTIIENMRVGVIVADSSNRIVKMNAAAIDYIGFDATGRDIEELKEYCDLDEMGRKEKEVERDGKRKFYEISVTPLFDRYKTKIGCMAFIYDITELRKALEKEKEFKMRTAHYFFNPILIAKGYLEMVREKCHHEEIEKAIRAIERIENVIKNIVREGEIKE